MHPLDQGKIAIMTEGANYCYKVMPFGLKNAGAIYQRLMDRIFAKKLEHNIEVYVDDMVIKSKRKDEHCKDLEDIFNS